MPATRTITPPSHRSSRIVGGLLAPLLMLAPAAFAPTVAHAATGAKRPPVIRTTTLPAPTAGAPYDVALRATGGTAPYHWSIATGALPKGLALSDAGELSGTPKASGGTVFTVAVADSAAPPAAATAPLALDVGPQRVYVANTDADTVTEYGLAPKGDIPPVAAIAGAPTGPAAPGAITIDHAGDLYVVDTAVNAISVYTAGTTDQPPVRTISGPDTGLVQPAGLAVDARGDLYVTNHGTNSVTEYTPTADGDAAPVATISGPATGLTSVDGIAIDPNGRVVVGAGLGTLEVFPPGATGNFTPVAEIGGADTGITFPVGIEYRGGHLFVLARSQEGTSVIELPGDAVGDAVPLATISGPDTQLLNSGGLAVDDAGAVYVTNEDSLAQKSWVSIYAPGASGDAAPAAVLQGARTGLEAPAGIAIGDAFFAATTRLPDAQLGVPYSQTLHAALGVAPYSWTKLLGALPPGLHLSAKGVIKGTPRAFGIARFALIVDDSARPARNTALANLSIDVGVPPLEYVADSSLGNSSIAGYDPGGNGDAGPEVVISGPDTGLDQPQAIAFDGAARLYVANYSGSVTVYPADSEFDATPSRTITGSNTGILAPSAVAVDGNGDLFVANELAGTVTEYGPKANGNVAPKATITGLSDPSALAFDPDGRLWVSSGDTLEAFDPGASGAATPVATLGGADTGLDGVKGLAFDSDGWLHVSNLNSGAVTT